MRANRFLAWLVVGTFLGGCSSGWVRTDAPTSMTYAPADAARAEVPTNVTRVTFVAEHDDQLATLHDAQGRIICQLPCTAWVPPASGFYVDVPIDPTKSSRIDVPDVLPMGGAGTSLRGVALRRKGSQSMGVSLSVGGGVLVGVGMLLASANCSSPAVDANGTTSSAANGCFLGAGLTVAGVGIAVAGLVLAVTSRAPKLELSPAGSGVRLGLTPNGIGGTF